MSTILYEMKMLGGGAKQLQPHTKTERSNSYRKHAHHQAPPPERIYSEKKMQKAQSQTKEITKGKPNRLTIQNTKYT